MFEGYALALLLLAIGVLLLMAEMVLPSHGFLAVACGGCFIAAVFICFWESPVIGTLSLVGLTLVTPLLWAGFIRIWPHTPVGRRLILPAVTSAPSTPPVTVGQSGTAISELRPMGLCDFDGVRLQVMSEHGIVEPGRSVKIIAIVNDRPTVRVA